MQPSKSGSDISQYSSFMEDKRSASHLEMKEDGLQSLSFEGNTSLGDKGARALASLIRTPNNNTKQLTMINLNQCGITGEGFEELKNALLQRGNLA